MNYQSYRFSKMALACVAGVTSLITMPSYSEEGVLALEEIVVTAQKREQSLNDVPLSVNAFSGDALEKNAAFDFVEIDKMTAGVNLEGGFGLAAQIKIRGAGNERFGFSSPGVAVVVDGVSQGSALGSAFSTLFDIERVEILRGPQGTLYGQNAPAGAVSVTTKNPDTEAFSGSVEQVIASNNTFESRVVANIPLIEGVLAARVSGFYAETDGYIDNKFLGVNADDRLRRGGRARILYTPTDRLRADLAISYNESYLNRPRFLVDGYGSAAASMGGLFPGGVAPSFDIFDFEDYSNVRGSGNDLNESASLTIGYELDNHTLTSISSYAEVEQGFEDDRDLSPSDGLYFLTVSDYRTVSQELRLTSTGDGNLEYMLGLFYHKQESMGKKDDPFKNGVSFSGKPASGSLFPLFQDRGNVEESFGVFTHNTYHFNEEWALTAGLRYGEDRRVKSEEFLLFGSPATGFAGESDKFYNMSGSLKLHWTPVEDQLYYISLDSAYRAGGININLVPSLRDRFGSYGDETGYALEIGAKTTLWDGRLQLNAAAYYQEYKDVQVGFDLPSANLITWLLTGGAFVNSTNIIVNGEDAVSRGVELDATVLLSENWTVTAAVSYNDFRFGDYKQGPCGPGVTPTDTVPVLGAVCDLTDDRIGQEPHWSASLNTEYTASLADTGMEWFVRGNYAYSGERGRFREETVVRDLHGYGILDLYLGLRDESYTWELTAWVKNATNDLYISNPGEEASLPGVVVAGVNPPRSYGVTGKFKF